MKVSPAAFAATLPRLSVRGRDRATHLAAAATIAALALAAFAAVRATGGTPNALGHLGYAPIIVAAFFLGWRGGVASGVLMGALLGPAGAAIGMHTEGAPGWVIRAVFFVSIGALTGALFDYVRANAHRWESTATRVIERERDGMLALARGAEAKDTDTGEHVRRVQITTQALAGAAGLGAEEAACLGWAAMLHDVGKLHVPDRILLKPGPLSAKEWAIMRQHPVWGAEILANGDGFELARRIARWHHENLDGSGYPDGLAGTAIPLEARIVRVTDAFDAMTNRRPYTARRSVEDALEELDRCKGRMFDPDLVALMVRLMRDPGLSLRISALRSTSFPGDRSGERVVAIAS